MGLEDGAQLSPAERQLQNLVRQLEAENANFEATLGEHGRDSFVAHKEEQLESHIKAARRVDGDDPFAGRTLEHLESQIKARERSETEEVDNRQTPLQRKAYQDATRAASDAALEVKRLEHDLARLAQDRKSKLRKAAQLQSQLDTIDQEIEELSIARQSDEMSLQHARELRDKTAMLVQEAAAKAPTEFGEGGLRAQAGGLNCENSWLKREHLLDRQLASDVDQHAERERMLDDKLQRILQSSTTSSVQADGPYANDVPQLSAPSTVKSNEFKDDEDTDAGFLDQQRRTVALISRIENLRRTSSLGDEDNGYEHQVAQLKRALIDGGISSPHDPVARQLRASMARGVTRDVEGRLDSDSIPKHVAFRNSDPREDPPAQIQALRKRLGTWISDLAAEKEMVPSSMLGPAFDDLRRSFFFDFCIGAPIVSPSHELRRRRERLTRCTRSHSPLGRRRAEESSRRAHSQERLALAARTDGRDRLDSGMPSISSEGPGFAARPGPRSMSSPFNVHVNERMLQLKNSFDSELVGLNVRDAASRTLPRPLSTGGIGRQRSDTWPLPVSPTTLLRTDSFDLKGKVPREMLTQPRPRQVAAGRSRLQWAMGSGNCSPAAGYGSGRLQWAPGSGNCSPAAGYGSGVPATVGTSPSRRRVLSDGLAQGITRSSFNR